MSIKLTPRMLDSEAPPRWLVSESSPCPTGAYSPLPALTPSRKRARLRPPTSAFFFRCVPAKGAFYSTHFNNPSIPFQCLNQDKRTSDENHPESSRVSLLDPDISPPQIGENSTHLGTCIRCEIPYSHVDSIMASLRRNARGNQGTRLGATLLGHAVGREFETRCLRSWHAYGRFIHLPRSYRRAQPRQEIRPFQPPFRPGSCRWRSP